jgi:pimeloyl-ACP methyl ester carboxylesterase
LHKGGEIVIVKFLKLAGMIALTVPVSAFGQIAKKPATSGIAEQLGSGFESNFVAVNGTTLHYVRGGTGPAVVLIHGFPEDWYEFRKVMPLLAKRFTVVAVDLRGVGGSAATPGGYDAANLAEDIHQLAAQLHLEHVYLFGHDIGGMVAYAFARRYPQEARGVMILDVAFPGLDPWKEIEGQPAFWHIRFHQTDLPEKLVAGRQAIYFRYFLWAEQFSNADVAHYAKSYGDAEHLRTAFELYRAFPENGKFNAEQRTAIDLPFVLGSGELDAFANFVPRIAEAMRAHGCANVRTTIIRGSVHYVAEEQPKAVAELILRYASE